VSTDEVHEEVDGVADVDQKVDDGVEEHHSSGFVECCWVRFGEADEVDIGRNVEHEEYNADDDQSYGHRGGL
jgi:hypothetical protein